MATIPFNNSGKHIKIVNAINNLTKLEITFSRESISFDACDVRSIKKYKIKKEQAIAPIILIKVLRVLSFNRLLILLSILFISSDTSLDNELPKIMDKAS